MELKYKNIISEFEAIQENMLFGFKLLSDNQKISLIMKVDLVRLLEAKQHPDIEVYNKLAKKYNIAVNSVRESRYRIDKSNIL